MERGGSHKCALWTSARERWSFRVSLLQGQKTAPVCGMLYTPIANTTTFLDKLIGDYKNDPSILQSFNQLQNNFKILQSSLINENDLIITYLDNDSVPTPLNHHHSLATSNPTPEPLTPNTHNTVNFYRI